MPAFLLFIFCFVLSCNVQALSCEKSATLIIASKETQLTNHGVSSYIVTVKRVYEDVPQGEIRRDFQSWMDMVNDENGYLPGLDPHSNVTNAEEFLRMTDITNVPDALNKGEFFVVYRTLLSSYLNPHIVVIINSPDFFNRWMSNIRAVVMMEKLVPETKFIYLALLDAQQ